jgi:hypothetical protein
MPLQKSVTDTTIKRKRNIPVIVISILLIAFGAILFFSCLGLVLSEVFGPRIEGSFVANDCGFRSKGGGWCIGSFTTADGKYSINIGNGNQNEVDTSNDVTGQALKAYVITSNESTIDDSSTVVIASDSSGIISGIVFALLSVLFVWVGIMLIRVFGRKRSNPGMSTKIK